MPADEAECSGEDGVWTEAPVAAWQLRLQMKRLSRQTLKLEETIVSYGWTLQLKQGRRALQRAE